MIQGAVFDLLGIGPSVCSDSVRVPIAALAAAGDRGELYPCSVLAFAFAAPEPVQQLTEQGGFTGMRTYTYAYVQDDRVQSVSDNLTNQPWQFTYINDRISGVSQTGIGLNNFGNWTFQYNRDQLISVTLQGDPNPWTLAYIDGKLLSITKNGAVGTVGNFQNWRFDYSRGLVSRVTRGDGIDSWTFQYQGDRPISATRSLGNDVWTFQYSRGDLVGMTRSTGLGTWNYQYRDGRLISANANDEFGQRNLNFNYRR